MTGFKSNFNEKNTLYCNLEYQKRYKSDDSFNFLSCQNKDEMLTSTNASARSLVRSITGKSLADTILTLTFPGIFQHFLLEKEWYESWCWSFFVIRKKFSHQVCPPSWITVTASICVSGCCNKSKTTARGGKGGGLSTW